MKQRFSKRTRLVSALLTLAMVFTFLPFSAFAEVQTYIPLYKFQDETFREYLKQFDKDDDTFLSTDERNAVKEINVANKNISNLYGIQFFPNLEKLDCDQNNLSSLDVSQNPALEYLLCAQNKLTSLDVSKNEALKLLNCKNNQLTNLNVEYTNIDPSVFLSELLAQDNTYPITVGSDRTFNLSALPGKFEVSKADNWNGGSVNGNTLTVNKGETQVTYTYDCGKDLSETFTLNVTVGIRIYGDNFPNYEFRQYLKANIDKNGDGYLNDTELNIRKLDVSGQHIANLKGIEFFHNLETLYCYNNKLTSLDVSKNPELKELKCYNNKLTSLDVSKNEKLETLYCSKNQLTSLDVSKNTALEYLWCSQNNLTSLDVTQNTALKDLSCYDNQLTSLDVSKNPALEWLMCFQNKLTKLDVSKNTALKYLDCKENNLTSLDVNQTAVTTLKASSNRITIKIEETSRTFDLSKLPGFEVSKVTNWSGGTVSGKTLKVNEGATEVTYTYNCGKGCGETFTLNVTVVPDGTVTPPSGGDTPGGSTGGGDGGGAVVIVAAAGAVAAGVVGYGVYNYVSGRKLQALLPEGVAAPENRAQTALLLWNTAGRPEPAEAPAFADVADPDTAKAAQWCVEQGLMKRRLNGKFAPGSSIPAYQVLNAYRKLAG